MNGDCFDVLLRLCFQLSAKTDKCQNKTKVNKSENNNKMEYEMKW